MSRLLRVAFPAAVKRVTSRGERRGHILGGDFDDADREARLPVCNSGCRCPG